MSLLERLYFMEVIKGIAITSGHLVRNFSTYLLKTIGLRKNSKAWATTQYPDEVRKYELTETGFDVLALNRLPASIFADASPLRAPLTIASIPVPTLLPETGVSNVVPGLP